MNNTNEEKKRDFLYTDENVKYSVVNHGDQITIHCEHPIFVKRFNGSSTTLSLEEFGKVTQKGSTDYDFFEKFNTSLQEYFINLGVS